MQGAYGGLIIIIMYANIAQEPPVVESFFLQTDTTPILLTDNTNFLLTS